MRAKAGFGCAFCLACTRSCTKIRYKKDREQTLTEKTIMLISNPAHPVWAMAFRPFYLLAALFGAVAIVLWGFGYPGHAAMPGFIWHAHEMIWGYAGAVVVGFLLTAVATWTGQPPTRGGILMLLAALWLLARASAFFAAGIWVAGISGTVFYLLAAACFARPVLASGNQRNFIAVAALLLLGITHAAFHWQLAQGNAAAVRPALWAGLVMVAGFIGLIGMRVIPFFTAKRLGIAQAAISKPIMLSALLLPMLMTLNLLLWPQNLWLFAAAGVASGLINAWQLCRWWHGGVKTEPLLWVLFIGFGACALGLIALGMGVPFANLTSLGIHLIAVGGIGLLTLGMMARTALGHTGRPMRLVPPLPLAFWLMVAAALLRALAALFAAGLHTSLLHADWSLAMTQTTVYSGLTHASALAFAASLLLFAWRYAPWLLRPRTDGKAG